LAPSAEKALSASTLDYRGSLTRTGPSEHALLLPASESESTSGTKQTNSIERRAVSFWLQSRQFNPRCYRNAGWTNGERSHAVGPTNAWGGPGAWSISGPLVFASAAMSGVQ